MKAVLSQAADWMHGELRGDDVTATGVSIDSRTVEPGELFFAIGGPNFDGHDFAGAAIEKGAAAVVVDHELDINAPQVVVDDCRAALGDLGREWRKLFSPLTVGITGSNGKTTLRAMIASCLEQVGTVLATRGNLNNDLGVPLMLSEMSDDHEYAVIEMGANRAGDIELLVSYVRPQIVLLSNAGPAHLEGFGSLDGVARAKGEIFQGEPRPDCAVQNADDVYYEFWQGLAADIRTLSFGLTEHADVSADSIELSIDGSRFNLLAEGQSVPVSIRLPGEHNVRNACATAAVCLAAGLDLQTVARGLEAARPVGGRIAERRGINGCRLFDDSYNANPASVAAAGRFLASIDGDRVMVVGDMFELGSEAERMHRELGEELKQAGLTRLLALGDLSRSTVDGFGEGAHWYASEDALFDALTGELGPDSRVLVKGSRSMHMERLVERLESEGSA